MKQEKVGGGGGGGGGGKNLYVKEEANIRYTKLGNPIQKWPQVRVGRYHVACTIA